MHYDEVHLCYPLSLLLCWPDMTWRRDTAAAEPQPSGESPGVLSLLHHYWYWGHCDAVNVHSIRSQWIKIKFYWFHLSQCNAKIQIWNNVSSGHNTYILYLMTTSTWTLKLISDPIRDSFKHQWAALVLDTHFRTVSIVGARFSWSIYVNKISKFFHNIQSE